MQQPATSVLLGLCLPAKCANWIANPILNATAWACPIPRTLTPVCEAYFAAREVQAVADRACPISRVAVDPLAPQSGAMSVSAAMLALHEHRTCSATRDHSAIKHVPAVEAVAIRALPCLLVMCLWRR